MTNYFKKTALVASVAGLALATPAYAADPVETTATASVRLYDPLEVTKIADLDYGTVYRSSTYNAGSAVDIAIDTANAVDCSASTELTCSGTPTAGQFKINADNESTVTLTFGGSALSVVAGEAVLTLDGQNTADSIKGKIALEAGTNATLVADATNPFLYEMAGAGDDDGTAGDDQYVFVTGSLTIPVAADAADDKYTADFTLTADYK